MQKFVFLFFIHPSIFLSFRGSCSSEGQWLEPWLLQRGCQSILGQAEPQIGPDASIGV